APPRPPPSFLHDALPISLPPPPGPHPVAPQALPAHPQLGPVGADRPDPAPRDRLEAPARGGDQRQPPPAPPGPDPLRAGQTPEDPPRHDQDEALSGRPGHRDRARRRALLERP